MTAGPTASATLGSRRTGSRSVAPNTPPRWWGFLVPGVAAAAAAAAAAGLWVDGVYGTDAATAEMLRGYDLVTLVAAVPLLALALVAGLRGSLLGLLVTGGVLASLAYTYAYYVFGTGFNDLRLLHAVVLAGSAACLVPALRGTVGTVLRHSPRRGSGERAAAVLLAVLAGSLGAMWVYACVAYAVTGEIPAGSALVETDMVVKLGVVLDLTLLVPLYGAAAAGLWRRTPWGCVLAWASVVSGILHQLGYLAALVFQDVADVPGSVPFDPLEPVILLVYVAAGLLLLRGLPGPVPGQDAAGPGQERLSTGTRSAR